MSERSKTFAEYQSQGVTENIRDILDNARSDKERDAIVRSIRNFVTVKAPTGD